MVCHVPRGEYPRDRSGGGVALGAAFHCDVAVPHGQLSGKDVGVGFVADGDEDSGEVDLLDAAIQGTLDLHAGHATVITEDFLEGVVPHQGHVSFLGLVEQLVLQDLFRAEAVPAVYQHHFATDVGEIKCLLHGGIATPDHRHFLVAVEEAIAGRTATHALAHERLFGRQSQVLGGGAGGDDQGVAAVGLHARQQKRSLSQVDPLNVIKNNFSIKAFCVFLHALHEVWALQAFHVAGPIIHFGGGGELAALLHAGDHHGIEICTGGVNGGAPAGGAGAKDDETVVLGCRHGTSLGRVYNVIGGNDKVAGPGVKHAFSMSSIGRAYRWLFGTQALQ